MKKTKLNPLHGLLGAVIVGGMLASTAAQAEITMRGAMLANTCVGCHGTNGVSTGPAIPTIAGISKAYFTDNMKSYRDGSRPSTVMGRLAKAYSDQDISDMADYFSAMKYVPHAQTANADMVAKGQKLHAKYCEKCHSENGTNPADDSGYLKGQWKPYLQYNLHDFTHDVREAPEKMAKKLKELQTAEGADAIANLIEFYASK
jgi:sulfide dehydrogenase cytochrome subunit